MNSEETLAALVAEIGQLRATVAQQQDAIAALQRAAAQGGAGQLSTPTALPDAIDVRTTASGEQPAEVSHGEAAHSELPTGGRGHTTRRKLLQGAAVGAAAATVAAVSLGSIPEAHAATGGNLVLGAANDANATTSLANTSGSAPTPLLTATNNDTVSTTGSTVLSVTNNNSASVLNDGIDSTTTGGTAMYGVDQAGGTGVEGDGYSAGAGVVGFSDFGLGVVAFSGTGVDLTALGTGRILQYPQSTAGIPSGGFLAGESIRDSNGDLWLCTATGTPGTWVKVAHLAPGATSGGAITYISKPIRLLDTRSGQPALNTPGSPYAGGSTHSLTVAGVTYNSVTVPASAVGAIGNVTVVNPSGGGYLALVPHGAGFSGTAVLAFSAGQVVSNSFNVGLASGQLDIIIGGGSSTDVILDLFAVVA